MKLDGVGEMVSTKMLAKKIKFGKIYMLPRLGSSLIALHIG